MVGGGLLVVIAAGLFVLYRAFQHVPDSYLEAIQLDPALRQQASDRMLQQTAALLSDVKKEGCWQALFTAEQINGWLAVDLVENHPQALSEVLHDPRVAIEPDRMMFFYRFRQGDFSCVVTLTIEPYVPEPNLLALRICKVRVGSLPWPLGHILDRISQAAVRTGFYLRWRQADGDPVALITIPSPPDRDDKIIQIETLRLGKGEIYLAGTTRRCKRD